MYILGAIVLILLIVGLCGLIHIRSYSKGHTEGYIEGYIEGSANVDEEHFEQLLNLQALVSEHQPVLKTLETYINKEMTKRLS